MISHSIPTIGKVQIELTKYPKQIFQILSKFKETGRLKNLLHLGTLHDFFPGVDHTRWDYTLTTMYFIQLFGEAKFKGLSHTAKLSGIEISGRDMMQVMALLSNIGHLPGTFSVRKEF